jgi:hypothetical protein
MANQRTDHFLVSTLPLVQHQDNLQNHHHRLHPNLLRGRLRRAPRNRKLHHGRLVRGQC